MRKDIVSNKMDIQGLNYYIERSIKSKNIDLARSLLGVLLSEDDFKLTITIQNDVIEFTK